MRPAARWSLPRPNTALWQVWRRCFQLSPALVMTIVFWVVAGALAQVLVVLPAAHVVALIDHAGGRATLSVSLLAWPVVALSALIAVAAIARVALDAYTWKLGRMFNGHMRADVMQAVSGPPDVAQLEDPQLRDRLNMAVGVGPGRYNPGGSVVRVSQRATAAAQTIGAVILLAKASAAAAVCVAVTVIICRRMFVRTVQSYALELVEHAGTFRRVNYVRELIWQPSVARELRIFTMWPWVRREIETAWDDVDERLTRHRRAGRWVLAGAITVFAAGFGAALTLTFTEWSAGRISLSNGFIALSLIIGLAISTSRRMVDADQSAELGAQAMPAAAALIEASGRMTGGGDPLARSGPAAITCHGLSFAYPWGERGPALSDVSLDISPGERIGIVGLNGSGKTTLLKLMCGFHEVAPAHLVIDGVDMTEIDRAAWQHSLAVVHQDFARYPCSLLFNIAPEPGASRELVRECLADVGLDSLTESLPDGLDTTLELGTSLSGGQWQRIAIARALYKVRTGSRAVILDEPTASLDPTSEVATSMMLAQRCQGLTTVIVSHRLPFVRNADRIVVLDDGRVVEQGRHDDLVQAQGLYSAMFAMQATAWTAA